MRESEDSMKTVEKVYIASALFFIIGAIAYIVVIDAVLLMSKPQPKPVYFLTAGAPDSIPCSSEINQNCMEYVRK